MTNNKISPAMHVAISEARHAAESHGDVLDKLRAAMKVTKDHWLVYDDDERLRCAIAGVMVLYPEDSEEYQRILWEVQYLQRLNAALIAGQTGVVVDWSSVIEDDPKYADTIGLLKLWKEIS